MNDNKVITEEDLVRQIMGGAAGSMNRNNDDVEYLKEYMTGVFQTAEYFVREEGAFTAQLFRKAAARTGKELGLTLGPPPQTEGPAKIIEAE